MSNVPLPLAGGCSCGAIRYEVSSAPLMVYNCHCTNCQKVSGGAFSTAITILEAGFALVAGEPRTIEWSSDAGNLRYGVFCGSCGSRIANGQRPAAGFLSLRAGTLDDPSWIRPVGDIWLRSAQPWVTVTESRLRAERQPQDYAPYIERFNAQGNFPG
jgi:hypothetical protein